MKLKKHRALYVIPGSLALILSLGRCSPIAPSVNKQALINASHRGTSPEMDVTGISPSQPLASNHVHVLLYKTRVLDGDGFADTIGRIEDSSSSRPGTVLVRLSGAQIAELRKFRKVPVQLGGLAPSEVTVLLEVSLPRRVIDENDVAGFDSSLIPSSAAGAWSLSIPKSPDTERERLAQLVLGNLEQVALQAIDPSLVPSDPINGTRGSTGFTGVTGISGSTGASGATGITGTNH